jgi:transcriptional regulator with XRE-family HTH domain
VSDTDHCWRPLEPAELLYLRALGARLAELRKRAGLSQVALARRAGIGRRHLQRLEAGSRRTRRSTLLRIAGVLDPGRAAVIADELVNVAGPGLAPEPAHPEVATRK